MIEVIRTFSAKLSLCQKILLVLCICIADYAFIWVESASISLGRKADFSLQRGQFAFNFKFTSLILQFNLVELPLESSLLLEFLLPNLSFMGHTLCELFEYSYFVVKIFLLLLFVRLVAKKIFLVLYNFTNEVSNARIFLELGIVLL